MDHNPDFRDLFSALNAARAEYLVVGGYAVIFHTEPRYTKDLDVLVRPTLTNARRVLRALKRFGAPTATLTEADFTNPEVVVQIGLAPNRVDLLTKVKGVSFATAWSKRVAARYADQRIWIMDAASLRRAKRAAGRPQDLMDLELLTPRRGPRRPGRR